MAKEIERLKGEIEQLLKQAEQLDAEQDAALGSRRGDELPEELKRREARLAKIQEAKARLEAQARARADEEQRHRDDEQARRDAEGRKRRGRAPAPIDPTPEDKVQMSFTDAEAKIMKQSNKGVDYSSNAQAVVDGADQIIVACEATNAAHDKEQAVPMAHAALDNLKAAGIERPRSADGTPRPIPNTADTGDFSVKAVGALEEMGFDPHIALGRQKHHEAPVPATAAATAAPPQCPRRRRHARGRSERRGEDASQAPFGARPGAVRGPQADRRAGLRHDQVVRGIRQLLLRGLEKVSAEWQLICLTHNLLKIWRRTTAPR